MLNREADHTTREPRSQIDSCSVISTRLSSAEMAEVQRAARAAGLRKGDWLKAAVRAHLDLPEPTNTEPSYLIVLAQIAALRCAMANCFALVPGVPLPHVELILAHADRQGAQVI